MSHEFKDGIPLPCGNMLLVEIPRMETVSKGGIIIPELESEYAQDKHRAGHQVGTVIALGPNVWTGTKEDPIYAEIGDRVFFRRYSGPEYKVEETGRFFIVINYEDILMILPPKQD